MLKLRLAGTKRSASVWGMSSWMSSPRLKLPFPNGRNRSRLFTATPVAPSFRVSHTHFSIESTTIALSLLRACTPGATQDGGCPGLMANHAFQRTHSRVTPLAEKAQASRHAARR